MSKSRDMESSKSMTQESRSKSALWGGTPQYDYISFEKCTRYGIPLEAGREARGTGDDLHYLDNSLSHPQVGSDYWDVYGSTGLNGVTYIPGAPGMVL